MYTASIIYPYIPRYQNVFSTNIKQPVPPEYKLVEYLVVLWLSGKKERVRALYELIVHDKHLSRVAGAYNVPKHSLSKMRLKIEKLVDAPTGLRLLFARKIIDKHIAKIIRLEEFYDTEKKRCRLCGIEIDRDHMPQHLESKHKGTVEKIVKNILEGW